MNVSTGMVGRLPGMRYHALAVAWPLLALMLAQGSWACEMTMGYRTNAKPPLISAAPSNEGLYIELFRTALDRMGCKLVIVREPKARVLFGLSNGRIDFYPGLNFSADRANYVHYLPNGLPDGYIGLTRRGEPDIRSLQDIADRKLVMVASYGGYDMNAEQFGVDVRRPHDVSLEQILQMIIDRRADFHAYNMLAVQYYLHAHPELAARLQVHPHCCLEQQPMYLGFSRQSGHIAFSNNPAFQPEERLSPENLPQLVEAGSRAAQLSKTLLEMAQDGTISRMYPKYFNGWDGSDSALQR